MHFGDLRQELRRQDTFRNGFCLRHPVGMPKNSPGPEAPDARSLRVGVEEKRSALRGINPKICPRPVGPVEWRPRTHTRRTCQPKISQPQPNKPLPIAYDYTQPAHNRVMANSLQFAIQMISSKYSDQKMAPLPPSRPNPIRTKELRPQKLQLTLQNKELAITAGPETSAASTKNGPHPSAGNLQFRYDT